MLAWAIGWAVALACGSSWGEWAWLAGSAVAAAAALGIEGHLRRAITALGFPLSVMALALAAGHLSAWWWLVALLPLVVLYPVRAWRDAPFFPTPASALVGLEQVVQPPPTRLLDAGCGLGHGLAALRRLWPEARLQGVEWSAPMAWLAARRVRAARVDCSDMWAGSWSDFDLVYLFQRPETMARAWAKAEVEIGSRAGGGWLVSLEFAVPGVTPTARLGGSSGRPLFVYRLRGDGAVMPQRTRSTVAAAGR